MKYIVTKYEVWAQPVEIEADDEDDAFWHGEGEIIEYSHASTTGRLSCPSDDG